MKKELDFDKWKLKENFLKENFKEIFDDYLVMKNLIKGSNKSLTSIKKAFANSDIDKKKYIKFLKDI